MKKFWKGFWRGVWGELEPIVWWSLKIVGWILWPLWWVLLHKPVRPVLETIGGGGAWRRASGLTHRMAARMAATYAVVCAVDIGVGLVLRGWWFVLVGLSMMSMSLAALSHRDYLCVRCAEEMPVNPSEEAERHRDDLRRYHRLTLPVAIAFLALALGSTVFMKNLLNGYGAALVGVPCIFVLFLPMYRWNQTHRRYQAWCPWCHPGDGGWGEDEFEPVDPDPHAKIPA